MTGCRSPDVEPVTIWIRRIDDETPRPAAAMLIRMAADRTSTPVELIREPDGRPRLMTGDAFSGLHVSISHSRDHVAAALSAVGPIGVDIEPLRDVPALALSRRWFDETEADWLATLPEGERSGEFLRLWTLKEATGKALGLGLRRGGMRRRVGPPDREGESDSPRALPYVPDVAATVFRYGDLIVAIACHGGIPTRVETRPAVE